MKNSTVLILIILVCMTLGCSPEKEQTEFQFQTMGTIARCELELPSGLSSDDAEEMVVAIYDSVNSICSTWQKSSELSRLNRAPADSAFLVSPLLRDCLLSSDRLFRLSAGAFDPTAEPFMRLWGFYRKQGHLPSQAELDSVRALMGNWSLSPDGKVVKTTTGTHFDLGGIAKGLAVDMARQRLQEVGVSNGLVDLGGNLFCIGGANGREDWRVGVRDPLNRDRFFASVAISELGVSTSGSYERFVSIDGKRYGHIMNPATGRPAEGTLSATVFAPTAILADGLSTAMFVMGEDSSREMLIALEENVEAILVIPGSGPKKAKVLFTPGLENRITIVQEYEGEYELSRWF